MIRIEVIDDRSAHLAAVWQLWRRNSDTLGFFPDGAFEDHARRKQVLVALNEEDEVVGYVLYRRSRSRAVIVHLCVDGARRSTGVARALVSSLVTVTQDCEGIYLRCRRDFAAHALWPRLGFVPMAETPGRGRDAQPLTIWVKSHGHPDLFSVLANASERRTRAVVDANVFFDLAAPQGRQSEESQALRADWLRDSLELLFTNELRVEIDRSDDPERRRASRSALGEYRAVDAPEREFLAALEKVTPALPAAATDKDRSDRRQLAWCAAAGVPYFLTRDGLLLEHADALFEAARITVIRPSEFIAHLDEIERASEYQPVRLAGTRLALVAAKDVTEAELCTAFQSDGRESRELFLSTVRKLIASARETKVVVVVADSRPLAILATTPCGDESTVSLMRVARDRLAPTIARHLLHRVAVTARSQGARIIVASDSALDDPCRDAISEDPFLHVDGFWIRAVPNVIGGLGEVTRDLSKGLDSRSEPVRKALQTILERLAVLGQAQGEGVERELWPAKILSFGTSYIVPIRPAWAQHLFDEGLASQDLFGARADLAMSRENVYYRASRPALQAPGRILWYVSARDDVLGSGQIRACSRLEEVVVASPKQVFRRFRRLGVYGWEQVRDTADKNGEVMALRFCDTECFPKPLPLSELRAILANTEPSLVGSSLPGPHKVSSGTFEAIYRKAFGT